MYANFSVRRNKQLQEASESSREGLCHLVTGKDFYQQNFTVFVLNLTVV